MIPTTKPIGVAELVNVVVDLVSGVAIKVLRSNIGSNILIGTEAGLPLRRHTLRLRHNTSAHQDSLEVICRPNILITKILIIIQQEVKNGVDMRPIWLVLVLGFHRAHLVALLTAQLANLATDMGLARLGFIQDTTTLAQTT